MSVSCWIGSWPYPCFVSPPARVSASLLDERELADADELAVAVADRIARDEQILRRPTEGFGGLGGDDGHHEVVAVLRLGQVGRGAEDGRDQGHVVPVDRELADGLVLLHGAGDLSLGLVLGYDGELALLGSGADAGEAGDGTLVVVAEDDDGMRRKVADVHDYLLLPCLPFLVQGLLANADFTFGQRIFSVLSEGDSDSASRLVFFAGSKLVANYDDQFASRKNAV